MKKATIALMAILCLFAVVSCSQTVEVTTYTVTFNANGTSATSMPAAQTVIEGKKASEPKDPVMPAGKAFAGWYKETSCTTLFNFNEAITEDTVIYASSTDAAPADYLSTMIEYYRNLEELPESLSSKADLVHAFYTSACDLEFPVNPGEPDIMMHAEAIVDLAAGNVDIITEDGEVVTITSLTDAMQGTITLDLKSDESSPTNIVYTLSYTGTFESDEPYNETLLTTGTCALNEDPNLGSTPFSAFSDDAVKTERFVAIAECMDSIPNVISKNVFRTTYKFLNNCGPYTSNSDFCRFTSTESGSDYQVNVYGYTVNIFTNTGDRVQGVIQNIVFNNTNCNFAFCSITIDGNEYKYTISPM